mgnify:CR=1 FL=1
MDTQLKKGVLELAILYQLREGEEYGYEIMKRIREEFPDVYEGSVYAILRRLAAENGVLVGISNMDGAPAQILQPDAVRPRGARRLPGRMDGSSGEPLPPGAAVKPSGREADSPPRTRLPTLHMPAAFPPSVVRLDA